MADTLPQHWVASMGQPHSSASLLHLTARTETEGNLVRGQVF